MRSTRLTLAVTALLAVAALAGCSGDDEGPESEDAPTPTEEAAAGHMNGTCRATVEVTGAVTVSWEGKGEVRVTDDGLAVYTAEDGTDRLAVYSADDAAPASVNFMSGDAQYSTPPGDDTGLEVAPSGRRATVAAAAADPGGSTVDVKADFTCKKAG